MNIPDYTLKDFAKDEDRQIKDSPGVYAILNIHNNRIYIGQSKCIRSRILLHRQKLISGDHIQRCLQSDFKKFGEDSFKYMALQYVNYSPHRKPMERFWMDMVDRDRLYNSVINTNDNHAVLSKLKIENFFTQKHMGDIREMENWNTAKDLAKKWGVTSRTINNHWNGLFRETEYNVNAPISPEKEQALRESIRPASAKNGRKKNNPQRSNSTPRPVKKVNTRRAGSWNWPRLELADFLALAVYGHTFLVWYEVAVIFALPGILSGVVVFALKHAAVTICRKEKFAGISDDALAVAFVLDGLAWYAHYTVFSDALPERLLSQMGNGAFWTAVVLGGVVAAGAWVSLLLIKKITVNKMWQ